MSERNFFRLFTHEIGMTPARFVQRARVEAARRMLEETQRSTEDIAGRCGFGSAETMRATFQRILGMSPQTYRAGLIPSTDGHRRRAIGGAALVVSAPHHRST